MIRYWPNQSGIALNSEVAHLFKKSYLKLNQNLHNQTSSLLWIDILNAKMKKDLFNIVLVELEILVLDIVELDLTIGEIKILNKKIIVDLVNKALSDFQLLFNKDEIRVASPFVNSEQSAENVLNDHKLLLEYLLIYLIFGGSYRQYDIYQFLESQIPVKHVEILIDNFLVQIADTVFCHLINSQTSLSTLFIFLTSNRLCNDTYISVRSIATFKNNMAWQYVINYYLVQPRAIYGNRYQVWILSPQGLTAKYLYAYRVQDFTKLSTFQIIVTGLLELQDFIYPKIRDLFLIIGKICIYLFSTLLGNTIKLLWRSFLLIIKTQNQ
jgi:hypothetical protein